MSLPEFRELDHLPEGILEKPASALYQYFDGPTLIHLRGRRPRPLVVSVLQHGNEDTGWEAIRRLLKSHYLYDELPRSLLILIGNPQGAKHRLRRLDDQPDFNRCWPGGHAIDSQYEPLFRRIHDRFRALDPLAVIDVHNNTGLNPHYAAVNQIRSTHLRIAAMFSPKVVYFTMPTGTLSHSMSPYCPALTLECGQAGEVHGTDHTMAYLETCLQLENLPARKVDPHRVHLFHMVATVYIRDEVLFGFGSVPTELALKEDLDHFNFRELPAGTSFGRVQGEAIFPLRAVDTMGHDVTDEYFDFSRGEVLTRHDVMPSMLTLDRRVIQQDCLCYLMERIHYEDNEQTDELAILPEGISRSDRPGEVIVDEA